MSCRWYCYSDEKSVVTNNRIRHVFCICADWDDTFPFPYITSLCLWSINISCYLFRGSNKKYVN